jgi:hypothetical protein
VAADGGRNLTGLIGNRFDAAAEWADIGARGFAAALADEQLTSWDETATEPLQANQCWDVLQGPRPQQEELQSTNENR